MGKKRQPSDVEGPNAQKLRKAESGIKTPSKNEMQTQERKQEEDLFKPDPGALDRFKVFQEGGPGAIKGMKR